MSWRYLRINIDRFEEINNALSYRNGDEVLRQFGVRLQEALTHADMIARLGADEFGVIVAATGVSQTASDIAHSITEAIETPFVIDGLPLDVHASIGIALAPEHADNADDATRRADMAMRAAKRSTAGFIVYGASIDPYDPRRLTLMGELGFAIRERRAGDLLPTQGELQDQPHRRCRGAVALAASAARHDRAGSNYPAGEKTRRDPAFDRMGAWQRIAPSRGPGGVRGSTSESPSIYPPAT